jgi:hypothetical protein
VHRHRPLLRQCLDYEPTTTGHWWRDITPNIIWSSFSIHCFQRAIQWHRKPTITSQTRQIPPQSKLHFGFSPFSIARLSQELIISAPANHRVQQLACWRVNIIEMRQMLLQAVGATKVLVNCCVNLVYCRCKMYPGMKAADRYYQLKIKPMRQWGLLYGILMHLSKYWAKLFDHSMPTTLQDEVLQNISVSFCFANAMRTANQLISACLLVCVRSSSIKLVNYSWRVSLKQRQIIFGH